MKIVSRKKPEEVELELDLNDLEDDAAPVVEPTQEEFEFYRENWVIQGAIKLGFSVYYSYHERFYSFLAGSSICYSCSELDLQSDPHLVMGNLRDTMATYTSQCI